MQLINLALNSANCVVPVRLLILLVNWHGHINELVFEQHAIQLDDVDEVGVDLRLLCKRVLLLVLHDFGVRVRDDRDEHVHEDDL